MNTAEDIVKDKDRQIVSIAHDETIYTACQIMVENGIGSTLVTKDEEIVGIWTERDLLRNTAEKAFDPKTARVGDYMSSPVHTAPHDTHIYRLAEMFLGLFLRHLIIEKDGQYIGFLSIGDVLRASLLEKDRQFKEINALVGWDYYEDWKWGRKKKKKKKKKK
jgi:signal-transduction protein with cAMP-binding, CBS, and nucleotidyltransferase domain